MASGFQYAGIVARRFSYAAYINQDGRINIPGKVFRFIQYDKEMLSSWPGWND